MLSTLYGLGTHAGFYLGLIIGIYPIHAFSLSMLSRRLSDKQLMTLLEIGELIGTVLLFRYQPDTESDQWRALFLVGSAFLYYNNSGQSGVLSSQLMKTAVEGHWFLDTKRLLAVYQFCTAMGFLIGALSARSALSVVYSQNMLAGVLGAFTVVQTLVTFTYFATRDMECCRNKKRGVTSR